MEIWVEHAVKAKISECEQRKVAMAFLCDKFNWKKSYYIKDDCVMDLVEYHTSHAWFQEEKVREATEMDYFVAGVFKKL